MPEVNLQNASATWNIILYAVALAVVVAGVLTALLKGWQSWKQISVRDRVKKLEGRMDRVEARLTLGDKRFDLQSDDLGHMLNTQQALMLHFLSGNDHDKLKEQITALSEYMTQRTVKAAQYAAEQAELQNGGNRHEGN